MLVRLPQVVYIYLSLKDHSKCNVNMRGEKQCNLKFVNPDPCFGLIKKMGGFVGCLLQISKYSGA